MFRGKKITFGKISANFGQNSKNDEPVESFGKFGKATVTPSKPVEIENLEDDLEHKEMKEIMGISGFGKKAKSFDVEVRINIFYLIKYLLFYYIWYFRKCWNK